MVQETSSLPSPPLVPKLPSEIMGLIVREFGRLEDSELFQLPLSSRLTLLALTLTSIAFSHWARPLLYKHINVALHQVVGLAATIKEGKRGGACEFAGRVDSFCLLHSTSNHGLSINPAELDENLDLLLRWISPAVKRVWLQVRVRPKTFQLLSLMDSMEMGIFYPAFQSSVPSLGPKTLNVSFTTYDLFSRPHIKALAPASCLRQIFIADIDLRWYCETYPPVFVDLVRQIHSLWRVVILPVTSNLYYADAHGRGVLGRLETGIWDAGGDLPKGKLQESIRIGSVPQLDEEAFKQWLNRKFSDGSVWEIDTVPFDRWRDIMYPYCHNC